MIISDGRKIKVYNGTGSTIDTNKIVVVKGKRVTIASNTNTDAGEYPLGYVLSSISPGGYGEVLLEGSIQNINTSSYIDGALLYLSTSGNITTTKPTTTIILGAVIASDPISGSIYFKVFFPKTTWGDITGNVLDQTDLQNALDDRIPYTGADQDVDLGTHKITMNDGVTDTEMSPSLFGVENNDKTQFATLEHTGMYVSNNTTSNTTSVTAEGITFQDASFQDTAFPPTGGTDTQYIKGDGTLGTLPTGGGIPKGTAAGTDTYTTTIAGATYVDGNAYLIRFTNGNTTSATLNINSIGAIPLYRNNDGPIVPGDILSGAEMLCVYNSATPSFQCIGTSPNTLLTYVTNDDTVTINKGQPVYASGGVGDRLKVKLAFNTGDSTSAQTIGLVFSTSIAAGQKGIIIMQGLLTGLSTLPTSTWTDGAAVYLGATAGSKTPTKPHAPNHLVYLGFVTTASNGSAGRLYVRVQNGYEMDEIHDVAAQNPNNGDTLQYNTSNNLWETKPIPVGMTWMGAFPG